MGLPAMLCFSVKPSRNSMTRNGWPSCSPDLMNRADVGMIESGCGLGFSLKAGEAWGSRRHPRAETSERQIGVADVLGLVDDTHPAAAELLDNAIVRDGLADHWADMLGSVQIKVNAHRDTLVTLLSRR